MYPEFLGMWIGHLPLQQMLLWLFKLFCYVWNISQWITMLIMHARIYSKYCKCTLNYTSNPSMESLCAGLDKSQTTSWAKIWDSLSFYNIKNEIIGFVHPLERYFIVCVNYHLILIDSFYVVILCRKCLWKLCTKPL